MRWLWLFDGRVDLTRGRVERARTSATLTSLEARLLTRLAEPAPHMVDRATLRHDVWGYGPRVHTQALEQAVRRLRCKLEHDPSAPRHLLTEHGVGYRLWLGERPPAVAPADRFVGRAAELRALDHWLDQPEPTLLTVVGAGGVGKSRLVRQWAHERGEQLEIVPLGDDP